MCIVAAMVISDTILVFYHLLQSQALIFWKVWKIKPDLDVFSMSHRAEQIWIRCWDISASHVDKYLQPEKLNG